MKTSPPVKFFTKANGENVAYAAHGKGPALLVPAWWVSHIELDWSIEPYQQFFLALGKYFTVVRYDRPGAGLSDRERHCFTLDDEVNTLREIVDHLGLQHVTLLGVSCGGPPCIAYTRRFPEKIERIIFIDSYLNGAELSSSQMQDALCSLVSAHWGLGAKAILDLFDPEMQSETRKKMSSIHRKSASSSMAAALLKLSFKMDASEAVAQLDVPTLVIHRTNDKTVPLNAGRKLAARLTNSEFISIDGKAHLPWMGDKAEDFIREIIRFAGLTVKNESALDTHNQFRKTGDIWTLSYAGKTVHLKDSRGLNDIATLIRNPGKDINVSSLVSVDSPLPRESRVEVIDQQAIQQYRQRLNHILNDKQLASQGDELAYAELEREEEQIMDVLKQSLGLGGQSRQFTHNAEKARKAVAARMRSAMKKIISVSPDLGEHLQASIKTGNFCSYSPCTTLTWLT